MSKDKLGRRSRSSSTATAARSIGSSRDQWLTMGDVVIFGGSSSATPRWPLRVRAPALRTILPRCIFHNSSDQLHGGSTFNLGDNGALSDTVSLADNSRYAYDSNLDWSMRAPGRALRGAWLGASRACPASRVCGAHQVARSGANRGSRRPARQPHRGTRASSSVRSRTDGADRSCAVGGCARRSSDAPACPSDRGRRRARLMATARSDELSGNRGGHPRLCAALLDPVIEFIDREVRGVGDPAAPLVTIEVAKGGISRGDLASAICASVASTSGSRFECGRRTSRAARLPTPPTHRSRPRAGHTIRRTSSLPRRSPRAGARDGAPDERGVERHADVLTFSAEPVAEPLDLMGPVRATLEVSADAPEIQVDTRLVDVCPSGRARTHLRGGAAAGAAPTPATPSRSSCRTSATDCGRATPCDSRSRRVVFPRYMPVIDPAGDSWTAVSGPRVEYQLRARSQRPLVPGRDCRKRDDGGPMTKVAVVTGCGRPLGIGRATARRLAADGYRVVVSDIGAPPTASEIFGVGDDPDALEQLAEEIRAVGVDALAVTADLADHDERRARIERAVAGERWTRSVNCAGCVASRPADRSWSWIRRRGI